MADIRAFVSYTDRTNKNFQLKKFAADVKKSKNYTELLAACVHNKISSLPLFDKRTYSKFGVFNRGQITTAMGEGFRFIDTYGSLQVLPFKVPEPGQELCLQVPNNIMERSETIKSTVRLHSSSKQPDIMDAHNVFVDISQKIDFTNKKIGSMADSIDLHLYLMWLKLLGTDPWGKEHADRYHTWGIEALAFHKWDDTAIEKFGFDAQNNQTKQTMGYILKYICDANTGELKEEIKKERDGFKNINVERVIDWMPLKQPKVAVGDAYPRPKPITQQISNGKIDVMYKTDNTSDDPTLNIVGACRCIMSYVDRMLNDMTVLNDPKHPGNTDKAAADKFGTEDGADKPLYVPMMIENPADLLIIMNKDLYRTIKNALGTSPYIKEGAYNRIIEDFLKLNILPIETLSYGAIKIVDKNRYNMWQLYDAVLTDTLGQKMYEQQTLHRGFMVGIREFMPATYLRLIGLYMDPMTTTMLKGWDDGKGKVTA